MTENQFKTLAENFAKFADIRVSFKRFVPSFGDKITTSGLLKGIGVGCNKGSIILADKGYWYAISFKDVEFPKGE